MNEIADPASKEEILASIQAGRGQLESLLAKVEPEQMLEPVNSNGWTVKDFMAHIAAWEKRMVQWMRSLEAGETYEVPASEWDIDRVNQQSYEENLERPLEEVQAEFTQAYEMALMEVENTPEADLMDPQRFPSRNGRPLWIMVAANTWWHYQEHEEALREWNEGREGERGRG